MWFTVFFLMVCIWMQSFAAVESSLAVFSNALDLVAHNLVPAEDPLIFIPKFYDYFYNVALQRIVANRSLEAPAAYKQELNDYIRRLFQTEALLKQNPSFVNRNNAYECMQLLAAANKLATILFGGFHFEGKNLYDIWLAHEEIVAFVALYRSDMFQKTLPALQRSLILELGLPSQSTTDEVIQKLKMNKLQQDSLAAQARLNDLLARRAQLDALIAGSGDKAQ